jgi:uncharacterized protein with PIN domain
VRFIVDDHLGKLARLLRALGCDVLWCRTGSDARIVEATAAGRLLVTRDTAWNEKTLPGPKLLLTESRPFDQLRRVLAQVGTVPPPAEWFSRCLECNELTVPVAKSEIAGLLPPYVRRTRDMFRRCPGCGRIYWEGTHVEAMRARLAREGIG